MNVVDKRGNNAVFYAQKNLNDQKKSPAEHTIAQNIVNLLEGCIYEK